MRIANTSHVVASLWDRYNNFGYLAEVFWKHLLKTLLAYLKITTCHSVFDEYIHIQLTLTQFRCLLKQPYLCSLCPAYQNLASDHGTYECSQPLTHTKILAVNAPSSFSPA